MSWIKKLLGSNMQVDPFFQDRFDKLVDSPNQSEIWWHSIPLPDGNRINGYNPDKDLQFKM